MTYLTDAEITSMRYEAELSLPDTAIIQRRTFTSDGGGGGTAAWSAAGTVACRIGPMNGSEREIANRISAEATSILTVPVGTDIGTADRVSVDSRTYNVAALREWGDYSLTLRAEVVEET